MFDKIDIEIPFLELFVHEFNNSRNTDRRAGYVDFKKYDFSVVSKSKFVDQIEVFDEKKAQTWDTISSAISTVAVGFFPEGNGFNEWPHVRLKASPAKILQGHNVFGSENIKAGVHEILLRFALAFPDINQHLDLSAASVRYLDCTYSARIESKYFADQIYRVFALTASSRQRVNANYDDYLKIGCGSNFQSLKIYSKEQEFFKELKQVTRQRKEEKIKIFSDKRLQDWVKDLIRFEATLGFRKMETMGIPTNLSEFLRFHDWYERTHNEPLCRYIWRTVFGPAFKQVEGQTMKRVDDNAVKAAIERNLVTYDKNGKPSMRRANAVWKTYRQIKAEGYNQLALENNSTFFRNVNYLIDCGFSRAFLKSLNPYSDDNTITMIEVINIDFNQQRPSWFVEPKIRHLRAVA